MREGRQRGKSGDGLSPGRGVTGVLSQTRGAGGPPWCSPLDEGVGEDGKRGDEVPDMFGAVETPARLPRYYPHGTFRWYSASRRPVIMSNAACSVIPAAGVTPPPRRNGGRPLTPGPYEGYREVTLHLNGSTAFPTVAEIYPPTRPYGRDGGTPVHATRCRI